MPRQPKGQASEALDLAVPRSDRASEPGVALAAAVTFFPLFFFNIYFF
jgi:hypothetical protein